MSYVNYALHFIAPKAISILYIEKIERIYIFYIIIFLFIFIFYFNITEYIYVSCVNNALYFIVLKAISILYQYNKIYLCYLYNWNILPWFLKKTLRLLIILAIAKTADSR